MHTKTTTADRLKMLDELAVAAMLGLVVHHGGAKGRAEIAQEAYELAEAMLARRAKIADEHAATQSDPVDESPAPSAHAAHAKKSGT